MVEAELDDLLSGLRIEVFDDVVSATLDKGIAHRFKIDDACFCPIDEELWTFERFKIIHGKTIWSRPIEITETGDGRACPYAAKAARGHEAREA
jgi:hypothetical protein